MHRLKEEPGQSRVKGEMIEGDEGLGCPGGNHIVRRIDAQAVAGNLQAGENGDVDAIQFDAAVESGA